MLLLTSHGAFVVSFVCSLEAYKLVGAGDQWFFEFHRWLVSVLGLLLSRRREAAFDGILGVVDSLFLVVLGPMRSELFTGAGTLLALIIHDGNFLVDQTLLIQ